MNIVISEINDNEHFEHTGDVHVIGNIGKNATVIVREGSLLVDDSVGNNTKIFQEACVVHGEARYICNSGFSIHRMDAEI